MVIADELHVKFIWLFLCACCSLKAADQITNLVSFTNIVGRPFINVRIEKKDGEWVSWVSSTNSFIFGRCAVSQLDQETYQKLGITDAQVFAVESSRNTADFEIHSRPKNRSLSERLFLGMADTDVLRVLGTPQAKNRSVSSSGVHEQWVYGKSYVYLQQGKVTSWQETE